jgi:hypothetical protein
VPAAAGATAAGATARADAGATAGADAGAVAAEADGGPANRAAKAATGTDEAASARRRVVFNGFSPAPKRHVAA